MDDIQILAGRVVVGLVFLVSGLGKATAPKLEQHVADYHVVPDRFASAIAKLLPYFECGVAVLLLAGILAIPVVAITVLALLVFSGAVSVNLLRGRHISCHCFGRRSAPISALTLVRNALLLAMSLLIGYGNLTEHPAGSAWAQWQGVLAGLAHPDTFLALVAAIVLSLTTLLLMSDAHAFSVLASSRRRH